MMLASWTVGKILLYSNAISGLELKKENEMAYEEEEARRSRVVVNTPTSQREVVRSEAVRHPERQGISGGVLAAIVVGVVALAAIAVLFLMNRQQQQDANANLASQPP